jgi:hypothetical protein
MVQLALIPNTDEQLHLLQFFKDFFTKAGNTYPTEAHACSLPCIDKLNAYNEYFEACEKAKVQSLSKTQFNDHWNYLWPGYQPKSFSGQIGSCKTCGELEELGTKSDEKFKEMVLLAKAIHKGGFYYRERDGYEFICYECAKQNPNERTKLSFVVDIPEQSANLIPRLGATDKLSKPLDQVIVGVKAHGEGVRLYRTPGNVTKSANFTVHIILSEIERFKQNNNGIPPEEIFIQCDGGSENANKLIVVLLELLVIKRVSRKIYFTRLPVGHTHADIDAIFGIINRFIADYKQVLTFEEWKKVVENALKQENMKATVVDIYILPNYHVLVNQIHHEFNGAFKGFQVIYKILII